MAIASLCDKFDVSMKPISGKIKIGIESCLPENMQERSHLGTCFIAIGTVE